MGFQEVSKSGGEEFLGSSLRQALGHLTMILYAEHQQQSAGKQESRGQDRLQASGMHADQNEIGEGGSQNQRDSTHEGQPLVACRFA